MDSIEWGGVSGRNSVHFGWSAGWSMQAGAVQDTRSCTHTPHEYLYSVTLLDHYHAGARG